VEAHLRLANRCEHRHQLAVVEGDCLCGGMSLLDACDLAIAADDVRFGFSEIEAGIFPFLAMANFYGRVSPKRTFDLFYSGRDGSGIRSRRSRARTSIPPIERVWRRESALAHGQRS